MKRSKRDKRCISCLLRKKKMFWFWDLGAGPPQDFSLVPPPPHPFPGHTCLNKWRDWEFQGSSQDVASTFLLISLLGTHAWTGNKHKAVVGRTQCYAGLWTEQSLSEPAHRCCLCLGGNCASEASERDRLRVFAAYGRRICSRWLNAPSG